MADTRNPTQESSVPFFMLVAFLLCMITGGQWAVLHTLDQVKADEDHARVSEAHAAVAKRQGLPGLFSALSLPEADARQALSKGPVAALKWLDPDHLTTVTVSADSPLSIQLSPLSWDGACPIVLSYLRDHPELLGQADLSFNGTSLRSQPQLADLSCGGEGSRSTLRVTAR